MAQTKPRKSYIPSCFGCVAGDSIQILQHDGKSSGHSVSRRRWFRTKKSGAKTVPVEHQEPEMEIQSRPKTRKKSSQSPVGEGAVADRNPVERPRKMRYGGTGQNVILENQKDDTGQKRLSHSRNTGAIPLSGSPRIERRSGPIASLTPPLTPENSTVQSKKKIKCSTPENGKVNQFDSIIGMSIILIILLIMVFCGRLFAILCTSAWLYFVPRLKLTVETDVKPDDSIEKSTKSISRDLNSMEHKKRVVFEGFLERNHRGTNGIL